MGDIMEPKISLTEKPEKPQKDCPLLMAHEIVPPIFQRDMLVAMTGYFDEDKTWADDPKSKVELSDPLVLIGFGWGGFTALQYAAHFVSKGGLAWRLYAVLPPVIFPCTAAGSLQSCAVTCIVPQGDVGGSWWR